RQQNPNIEYPEISGNLSDLLDRTALNDLPPLQGEYTIAYYDNQGTNYLLHVYFEEDTYEATGTPLRRSFIYP
ncbi:MAG: hypothetical protein K8I60_13260, partial [Anaerolineae bacterium]|nr:hypothetical protein [Anaerolineae bacterium]